MMFRVLELEGIQWLTCKGRLVWPGENKISGNEGGKIGRGQSLNYDL